MGSHSQYKMAEVTNKEMTVRRAVARGFIKMSRETAKIISEKKLPKGDALSMAEVAGILAAKKTADILPLCHPLPIESVSLNFDLQEDGVQVECEVKTTYKTGVEMEALMGVNGALLCIYDLTKPVDPHLEIHDVHLKLKEGGKSGMWMGPRYSKETTFRSCDQKMTLRGIKVGVLTISDRCSRQEAKDISGPTLAGMLTDLEAEVAWHQLVPDEVDRIQDAVIAMKEQGAELIITTGGTGFSPRDVTPEALTPLFTRRVEGFGELFRLQGFKKTPMSYLSRSLSGFMDSTLVIALPGSPKACRDGIEILGHLIPHAVYLARGGQHG